MKKRKATKQSRVKISTIWKAVGGGFADPGESKICKIGKHKVLVARTSYLDNSGTPYIRRRLSTRTEV